MRVRDLQRGREETRGVRVSRFGVCVCVCVGCRADACCIHLGVLCWSRVGVSDATRRNATQRWVGGSAIEKSDHNDDDDGDEWWCPLLLSRFFCISSTIVVDDDDDLGGRGVDWWKCSSEVRHGRETRELTRCGDGGGGIESAAAPSPPPPLLLLRGATNGVARARGRDTDSWASRAVFIE